MILPPILSAGDALARLSAGAILLLPVDTLLGLAVRADRTPAIRSLYRLKGRDQTKPFALAFRNLEQLEELVPAARRQRRLLRAFLPGPYTFILEGNSRLGRWWKPWRESVGVRLPGPSPASDLLSMLPWPLALSSANFSGDPAQSRAQRLPQRLLKRLHGRIDGEANAGTGSAVVDLRGESLEVLRAGLLKDEELARMERLFQ